MKFSLPLELQRALKDAERSPGWNTRSRDLRRFELAGQYGEPCTVYVVPFRRWAYRRVERQAQAWREEQARGTVTGSPSERIDAAARAAGIPADFLRDNLAPGDLGDMDLVAYARSLAREVRP